MRRLLPLLLALPLAAQEPEPGIVPVEDAEVSELVVAARPGDAREALRTFLEAHGKHKEGDEPGALRGYVAFLGMAGRLELPDRYLATVRARVTPLLEKARARYDAATRLYVRDRTGGLAALRSIADDYGDLPVGRAARVLVHSDALRVAINRAREDKDKDALAAAIARWPDAFYMYEAKKLLVELGGPDLLEERERAPAKKRDEEKVKEEREPAIEVSEDD